MFLFVNQTYFLNFIRGETLWDIAIEYNTTIEEIMEVNGLRDGNCIAAASKLIIPKSRFSTRGAKQLQRRWLNQKPAPTYLEDFVKPSENELNEEVD